MKKHYNITVKGRVQGVFFRGATKNTARYFDIKGFVKNNYDGSVYIEAEADVSNLNQFINWCHHGPDRAIVKNVTVNEDKLKDFTNFDVKY